MLNIYGNIEGFTVGLGYVFNGPLYPNKLVLLLFAKYWTIISFVLGIFCRYDT